MCWELCSVSGEEGSSRTQAGTTGQHSRWCVLARAPGHQRFMPQTLQLSYNKGIPVRWDGCRAGGNSLKPPQQGDKASPCPKRYLHQQQQNPHERYISLWDGTTQDQRQIWGVSVFFLAVANKGSSSLGWVLVTKGKIIFKIIQRVKRSTGTCWNKPKRRSRYI